MYHNPVIAKIVIELSSDLGFVEGPVLMQDGSLIVTSLTHSCLYRITGRSVTLFADLGGGPNGAAEAADGSIFVAQMGSRSWAAKTRPTTGGIQRVDRDGSSRWLTMDPISPNDLCFGPDGLLYWTDPTRGRTDDGRIWRMDPAAGPQEAELLTSVPWYPNGIAFGPEDDAVYVASYHDGRIVRFPCGPKGLGKAEPVIWMSTGLPDGLAFDAAGALVVAANAPDGQGEIQTWSTDGKQLDVFEPGPGSYYTNIAFGADHTLYVTHSDGGRVVRVDGWPTLGLPLHPFRSTRATSLR